MKKLLSIKIPEWTFPIILLLLCIASFGLLIPRLGFYWDDWAKTLVNRLFGLSGYWDYYAGDRPTSGWTHIVFVSLIGDSPIAWHVLTLIFRWLSAWGMWWCLSLLWPKAKTQNAIASLFFVIYPVFTMQAIAVTFPSTMAAIYPVLSIAWLHDPGCKEFSSLFCIYINRSSYIINAA